MFSPLMAGWGDGSPRGCCCCPFSSSLPSLLSSLLPSFPPPALTSFGAFTAILKISVFRAVGKLLWQVEFGHSVGSSRHGLLQPAWPEPQIPHPLISGGRITVYPLACGTGKIPNLTVLWLRGWLLMAEGLHLWKCHQLPMGRASDVLRQMTSSEHTLLGFPSFLKKNPENFSANEMLYILGRHHGVHVLEKRKVCGVCVPAQGYTRWRQPWPATCLPQADGAWSPWLLEK